MSKLGIWAIAIAAAFLVGVFSSFQSVDAQPSFEMKNCIEKYEIWKLVGTAEFKKMFVHDQPTLQCIPLYESGDFEDGQNGDIFLTYKNTENNFKIKYPYNWNQLKSDDPATLAFFESPLESNYDTGKEKVVVGLYLKHHVSSLDGWLNILTKDLQEIYPDLEILESSDTTLSNYPAKKIIFVRSIDGFPDKLMIVMTIADQTPVFITYIAEPEKFSKFLPTVQKMIDSFELLEGGISTQSSTNFLSYENTDMGISIDYPSDWMIEDQVFGTVGFNSPPDSPSDDFMENIGIAATQLIEPMGFQEIIDATIEEYQYVGMPIKESKAATLSNNPAWEILVIMTIEETQFPLYQFFTLKNDMLYFITFAGQFETISNYLPIYQRMTDSFVILEESETTGKDVRELVQKANQLYSQQMLKEALVPLEKVLIIQPTHYEALLLKAVILIESAKYVDAEKIADRLIELSEFDPSGILMKALSLASQEKYSEALPYVDEYLIGTPDDPLGLSIKGIVLSESGKYDEAKPIIEKALRLAPDDPFALYAQGYYYYKLKDYDQAIFYMDKSLEIDPSNLDFLSDKGMVLMDQGKTKEAESLYDGILKTNPTHSFALNNKGAILLNRGDNAAALEYFDKALEIEPDNLLFLRNKIATLASSGIPDVAQIIYNKILQLDPNFDEPLESITTATTSLDQFDTGLIKEPQKTPQIPDWIRNNAEWWAQGAIGDSDFVSGIQFLIKEDIILIPETVVSSSGGDSQEIPAWIKNNADWWSQGLISDEDFLSGLKYMVEHGIIRV